MKAPSLIHLLGLAVLIAASFTAAELIADGDAEVWPTTDAPHGVAKLGLNVPVSDAYLEYIRKLHRFSEPVVLDKLLIAQQLWRRAAVGEPGDPGTTYSLLDCTPMFVHKRSFTDLFRKVIVKAYTCHAICLNYPTCTATTPLAYVQGPSTSLANDASSLRLSMLLQCGMHIFSRSVRFSFIEETFDLRAGTPDNHNQSVCHNAVPRARNYDGNGSLRHSTTAAISSAPNVWTTRLALVASNGTEITDGLIINVNSLWAQLAVQPLILNTDYFNRPSEDPSHTPPILTPMKSELETWGPELRNLSAELASAKRSVYLLSVLWLITPEPTLNNPKYTSARFMHNQDPRCKRWLDFPYQWTGKDISDISDADTSWALCRVGFDNASATIVRRLSTTLELACTASDSGASFLYGRTSPTCSAKARLDQRDARDLLLNFSCGFAGGMEEAITWGYEQRRKFDVRGCLDVETTFNYKGLSAVGGCVYASARPAIEVLKNIGAYTYLDAAHLLDALAELKQTPHNITSKWPSDSRWMDLWVQANATAFEAVINATYDRHAQELENLGLDVILNKDRVGILAAFALLLVATLQLPLAYNKDVIGIMARLAGKLAPRRRAASLVLQYVGCSITLMLPVAAAFATLWLAAGVSPDKTVLPAYPHMLHELVPGGINTDVRNVRGDSYGLESVTAATVALTPDTTLLAVVGGVCFAVVMAFAAYAVWHEHRKQLRKAPSLVPSMHTNLELASPPPPAVSLTLGSEHGPLLPLSAPYEHGRSIEPRGGDVPASRGGDDQAGTNRGPCAEKV